MVLRGGGPDARHAREEARCPRRLRRIPDLEGLGGRGPLRGGRRPQQLVRPARLRARRGGPRVPRGPGVGGRRACPLPLRGDVSVPRVWPAPLGGRQPARVRLRPRRPGGRGRAFEERRVAPGRDVRVDRRGPGRARRDAPRPRPRRLPAARPARARDLERVALPVLARLPRCRGRGPPRRRQPPAPARPPAHVLRPRAGEDRGGRPRHTRRAAPPRRLPRPQGHRRDGVLPAPRRAGVPRGVRRGGRWLAGPLREGEPWARAGGTSGTAPSASRATT